MPPEVATPRFRLRLTGSPAAFCVNDLKRMMTVHVEHWALAISFVALIFSGASFGWSVYSWRNSGARLKLSVVPSFTAGPLGTFSCIGITVDNAGRLQTTVNQLYFVLPNRRQLVFWSEAFVVNRPPKEMPPGSSETFLISARDFSELLEKEAAGAERLTLEVSTGHGRFKHKIPKDTLKTLVKLGKGQSTKG